MARKDILKMFMVSLLFAIVAIGLSACSKDDEDSIEYWTVTLDDRESLLFYGGEIEGFIYEEGYMYQLLIKATPTLQQIGTCNPPPYTFKLVKIITKEKVDAKL
jgi:hypothetical protein